MSRFQLIGAVVCLVISTTSLAANEIYKWVNEKGQINYGSNPPVGVDAKIVTTSGGPSDEDIKEAKTINDSISGALSKPTSAETPASDLQAKQAACDNAKAEYEKFVNASRISVKDEQGNTVKADAEKRQAMIAERKDAVTKACSP